VTAADVAGPIHRETGLAGRARFPAAGVGLTIPVKIRIHCEQTLDFTGVIVVSLLFVRINPEIDPGEEGCSKCFDLIKVLSQPDYADTVTDMSLVKLSATRDETLQRDLRGMKRSPQREGITMGSKEIVEWTAEIGLNRDAINMRHVGKGAHQAPIVPVGESLTPRGDENANALLLRGYPLGEALQFLFVLVKLGASV